MRVSAQKPLWWYCSSFIWWGPWQCSVTVHLSNMDHQRLPMTQNPFLTIKLAPSKSKAVRLSPLRQGQWGVGVLWLGSAVTDVTDLCDLRWSHMCAVFLIGEVRGGMDFPLNPNHQGPRVTMTGNILRGHGALCFMVKTVSQPGQAGAWLFRVALCPCLLAIRT